MRKTVDENKSSRVVQCMPPVVQTNTTAPTTASRRRRKASVTALQSYKYKTGKASYEEDLAKMPIDELNHTQLALRAMHIFGSTPFDHTEEESMGLRRRMLAAIEKIAYKPSDSDLAV